MTSEVILIVVSGLTALLSNILLHNKTRKATKTDSKEITQIIESIKSDFEKTNSYNKAKIDYLFSTEREKKNDQKSTVLEFWEEHIILIRLCLSERYEIDEYRMTDFYSFRRKIESQEEKCELVFSRLYFLIEAKELIELAHSINHKVIMNSIKFIGYLWKIEPLLIKSKELIDKGNQELYFEYLDKIEIEAKSIDDLIDNNNVDSELDDFKDYCWSLLYPEK